MEALSEKDRYEQGNMSRDIAAALVVAAIQLIELDEGPI